MVIKVKKYLIFFTLTVFLTMAILPATNIRYITKEKPTELKLNKIFNVDSLVSLFGMLGFKVGVSIDPGEVLIGRDGWLFLGNNYSRSLLYKINGIKESDKSTITQIREVILSWDRWFIDNGVKEFKVMIAPDKDSVYREKLPKWYAQSNIQFSDVIQKELPNIYIDILSSILKNKTEEYPLYYKTDTHWNNYGAWIGFSELMKSLNKEDTIL